MKRFLNASVLFLGMWGLPGCASLPRLALNQDTLAASEHLTLADAYRQNKENTLAVRQYREALRQDPRFVPAWMALGNMAYEDHEWAKARSFFGKALKFAPNDATAMNNMAMTYVAEGKHLDRAVRLAEDGLLTDSGPVLKPYLMDTLAQIALREHRFDDAEHFLAQAGAAAPRNNPEFTRHLEESRQSLAAAIQRH